MLLFHQQINLKHSRGEKHNRGELLLEEIQLIYLLKFVQLGQVIMTAL